MMMLVMKVTQNNFKQVRSIINIKDYSQIFRGISMPTFDVGSLRTVGLDVDCEVG